jgi:hypothetical protein
MYKEITKEIENIKNVTIIQDFTTATSFLQNVHVAFKPDECIVRAISYTGPNTDGTGVYLIWSDLINDFIGTFGVSVTVAADTHNINVFPNIRILLKNCQPFNTQMSFKLYTVVSGNTQVATSTNLAGDFTMSLDFISYKK